MVYRVFVEKREAVANEAKALLSEIKTFLGISSVEKIRIFNRYDVEGISEELFEECIGSVFSEPQVDDVYRWKGDEATFAEMGDAVFAVEALPGQYDQRADSAAQCIQIISQQERPLVACAKVYLIEGKVSKEELQAIISYVINPVEMRQASLDMPETLKVEYELPQTVESIEGFNDMDAEALKQFIADRGLAMDEGDIKVCQDYFRSEGRVPTITEIKMIDTYWSDHCRHTTFNTVIDKIEFEDETLKAAYGDYMKTREDLGRTKPVTLMDLGTIAAKALKAAGKMEGLDESEEINACTVKVKVTIDGQQEDWLLLFKNETHNHPTEIEPFGGAATCIGGAIRDPLSGRAYVYTAMRITGAADPRKPLDQTMKGKLPQRKIVTSAADGYSSYGNQIGVSTGLVQELYHDGYVAKRMELGAVIGAAPAANVVRERPAPGDIIILLGGRTGRDGCGGATGSSKSHDVSSLESCGAEVQKGNAPEERKLQRLFRNGEASRMIKRCNDFGAGGVSVAIGELADGLDINLDVVPKKYEGLDGTELAISESQERMAVVIAAADKDRFFEIADAENLEATVVATVTEEPRLVMHWKGNVIVDISREFLDSNGAEKHIEIKAATASKDALEKELPAAADGQAASFTGCLKALAADINVCSQKGLSEKFDSTIGAGTVIMPFGGKYQMTPAQSMVQKISVENAVSDTCSIMAWGYDPFISEKSPYHGAYLAVVDSYAKLIAAGGGREAIYLSFQEFFEKLGKDPARWGKPLAALLGAFEAQMGLEAAAIGGKDSMSGSFEDIDVPPTLVSFAVTTAGVNDIMTNEFEGKGHKVIFLKPEQNSDGLPEIASLKKIFEVVKNLGEDGRIYSAYVPGHGGIAEAVMKMCFGNMVGFRFDEAFADAAGLQELFGYNYGSFILEVAADVCGCNGLEGVNCSLLGETTDDGAITLGGESVALNELLKIYEDVLEPIYPCNIETKHQDIPDLDYNGPAAGAEAVAKAPAILTGKPKVLIPAFPGTNCEYDSARAMAAAGAEPQIMVIRNMTAEAISKSVEDFAAALAESQMVFIPGGFSGGDEPDGSGKFITAFFRNPAVREAVTDMLDNRGGLMCGICNGFQALIKLGLVPYGKIMDTDENCPTLTLNEIGRHQSRLVRIRVASNKSPWLAATQVGDVYTVPVSHGEGRILADEKLLRELATNGQIATQYVDFDDKPSDDIRFNPNGSVYAVEGMTSPDGRIFGKMGHAERTGYGLYKNVPGRYDMKMFESAVKYFK
ncbi:MAG: phosphoribosylformylglycinamidine synthase [Clostridiales bacterium]|nr:phosphoribosylformylglycinamidine synthase [Clostridiales bacterium]